MMSECIDCKIPYSEMGVDLVLPNQVWNRMAEPEDILCANCICKRLEIFDTSALLAWPNNFNYTTEAL